MTREAQDIAGFERHGGRLCVARALYPQVSEPWIDLSTGINPTSYPAPSASPQARNRLPELTALHELERVAGLAFGIDAAAQIAAVSGTESAVRLLPHVLAVSNALVVEPTYSSHLAAWRNSDVAAAGIRFDALPDRFRAETALTVVNPNNPDGRIVDRATLRSLHDRVACSGGVLIVDEAFADIDPALSVADIAGTELAPRMIVLRSFGKFFGLAGLRLGFVIGSAPLVQPLRDLLGDWPVAVDAIAAGLHAYADQPWMASMRVQLLEQSKKMDALLAGAGFRIVGGTSLYRLVSAPDARQKFTHLLSRGVLARPFAYDATLLRFGLPGQDEWNRLSAVLAGAEF
jgi:cobalamin biosynthetic protein CobC